jgi:hypothetical protein
MKHWTKGPWYAADDANARLIAAAPDLAEALEFFYRQMWDGSQIDLALEKARSALEKAGAA